jgi:glyoxylase-like metal-dependent hydrolase (beta-lactamase superfamily II)
MLLAGALAVWFVCSFQYGRNAQHQAPASAPPPSDTLGVCISELETHRPSDANWVKRRDLLEAIDVPINARHTAAWKRDVGSLFQRQMNKALTEISESRVTGGVRIWRMYNMGFVVKSAEATIGFDIHPGWVFDNPMDQDQLKQLADQLDVAFVSHWHHDHCSREFLRQMLAAGKKIVLLDSLARELSGENVFRIPGVEDRPLRIAGVEVYGHTGWQYPTARNNVYVVRIGGLLVMHQGDNTKTSLYRRIAAEHEIDVLLGNCWAKLSKVVEGVKPKLLVIGHENEIKHPLFLRSGYKRTFKELDKMKLGPPWTNGPQVRVMFWGEHTDWPNIGSKDK